jgi:hypothetical protein
MVGSDAWSPIAIQQILHIQEIRKFRGAIPYITRTGPDPQALPHLQCSELFARFISVEGRGRCVAGHAIQLPEFRNGARDQSHPSCRICEADSMSAATSCGTISEPCVQTVCLLDWLEV